MLWAFLASPALSARRPPRVSRHAPARSQLSVSIFDLAAGQDDTRLADVPALCEWVEGAGGDGLRRRMAVGLAALGAAGGFVDGLPVGLQILGKSFDEETILRIAHAYEQATDWHTQKPALK